MNEAAALPSPAVVLSAPLKRYYGRLRLPPGTRQLPDSRRLYAATLRPHDSAGGPMEALAPLVGEQLGLERVPMEVSHDSGTHRIKVGAEGELEVQEIVPFGKENGEPARRVGIFHPADDDFAIAKATKSRISAFGIDFAFEGRSAFAAPFSWAA